MASTLPPDPYKLLGVAKDATIPEIRSAHRKLVLKCHPDKVQDAALKAIKQDEFQKVQQAYELLSDDLKRSQYDEQVKLFELRKEMGRGNPTPRSNPFEYQVKTAEPRPNSYNRPAPKAYTPHTAEPKSYEDVYTREDPLRHMPKKSSSYEDKDRKRKEDDIKAAYARKLEEEVRMREREKEREKRAYTEKKKSREKERRRGTEEKRTRTTGAYFEDDDSDDYHRTPQPRPSEKRSKQDLEEEIQMRNEAARDAARAQDRATTKESPLAPKWDSHMQFAGKYINTARRKASDTEDFQPSMRRAETFSPTSPPYTVRYAAPGQYSDDDSPLRSRAQPRRASDTPTRRKSSRERERRSSPTSHPHANIISPPSPPPTTARKPSLQTHTSEPLFPKPTRSKTTDSYSRADPVPNLPRAQTFQAGDTRESRRSGGSKLKQMYTSDSEPDSPIYSSPPRNRSPPRRAEPVRYVVQDSRAIPVISRHRSELRDMNDEYTRERSESPGGRPSRPPLSRNPTSSHTRSHSTSYYPPPEVPEPRIVNVPSRPKMPPRDTGGYRAAPKYFNGGFDNINYGPKLDPSNIIYSRHGEGLYNSSSSSRRGREAEYYPTMRGGNGVYAQ